jgi:hypothetical protein
MPKKRLTLRSDRALLSAYLISPVAGLSALWLCLLIFDVMNSSLSLGRDLLVLPWLFMFGGAICFIAEFVVVTPLLVGFQRYRWRWLNGWSACAIGFFMGQLPWLIFVGGGILRGNPARTTWFEAILQSFAVGIVGFVAALSFRLIAVRAEPLADED